MNRLLWRVLHLFLDHLCSVLEAIEKLLPSPDPTEEQRRYELEEQRRAKRALRTLPADVRLPAATRKAAAAMSRRS